MIRIKDLSALDRVSVALATALLSLLSSLAVSATSSPSAIPERFLGRVRGATPKFTSVVNAALPNCSWLEAYDLTAAGFPTVQGISGVGGCNATNSGPPAKGAASACVTCPPVANYQLSMVAPPPPGVFTTPTGVSCNPAPGGNMGTCTWIGAKQGCQLTDGYDCGQYAFSYGAEPPN